MYWISHTESFNNSLVFTVTPKAKEKFIVPIILLFFFLQIYYDTATELVFSNIQYHT